MNRIGFYNDIETYGYIIYYTIRAMARWNSYSWAAPCYDFDDNRKYSVHYDIVKANAPSLINEARVILPPGLNSNLSRQLFNFSLFFFFLLQILAVEFNKKSIYFNVFFKTRAVALFLLRCKYVLPVHKIRIRIFFQLVCCADLGATAIYTRRKVIYRIRTIYMYRDTIFMV